MIPAHPKPESSDFTNKKDFSYRLMLLNEMTQKMNLTVNEDEVFQAAALYTEKILRADRTSVALVNPIFRKIFYNILYFRVFTLIYKLM
ncbi:MAG: hypothetical protein GY749_00615 [Desulfobacteraceae bacterium]|nr:hypothetical protein [Desulfobacteraceae bacterium]